VCRAALAGARVLLLDEPTSSLPAASVARLTAVIRQLVGRGIAVLYISHFLEEVLAVADRVTVLRDGAVVRAGVRSGTVQLADLVTAMLGAVPDGPGPRPPAAASGAAGPAVAFTGVEVPGVLSGVSFTTTGGEVVGLAGLAGAGHLAALEVVCGRRAPAAGSAQVLGAPAPRSLRAAFRAGVGFVTSDRKRYGLMAAEPVWHNVAAVRWLGLGRGRPWLDVPSLVERAERHREALHIRGDVRGPAADLSGGNQQKVVLAKWLEVRPRVLVLDDPTRGVDVGARAELHRVLVEVAAAGTAVLVASTDLHELAAVCHRVLVFQRGRIVDELAGDRLTEAELSLAMNAGFAGPPGPAP
jgi:ABC-type sugar transport system ATPase subunit